MLGQRRDLDFYQEIDTGNADWVKKIERMADLQGKVHPPQGSDFFAFHRSISLQMPPFLIGRPLWDNWMIYFFIH